MDFGNEVSFEDLMEKLKNPSISQRRDPRTIRRVAVTSAIVDSIDDITPSKVYARAVTALEGSLTSENSSFNADAIGTQISLLELLTLTVPRVEPRNVLNATLPLTSRVLRGVLSMDGMETETQDELGGMNALLRWTCKVTCAILSALSPSGLDENEAKLFLQGTLLTLFVDKRPKVRKAAHASILEMLTSETRAPKLVVLTSNYVHNELQNALLAVTKNDKDAFRSLSHLLVFLEKSIHHLNYPLLIGDIMGIFGLLMKDTQTSGSSADFVVTARKVKESSPKLMMISSILSICLALMGDENQTRKNKVDEIASRVLASLLQAKPAFVFVSAELNLSQKVKTQYGQLIIASCDRLLAQSNLDVVVKLFPLAVQMLLALSLPDEDGDPDVAQTLMVELTQLFRSSLQRLGNHPKCLSATTKSMQVLVQDPTYQPTWPVALKCYMVLVASVPEQNEAVIESLVQLRNEAPKGSQFSVEDSLSTLVQTIGLESFWTSLQWNPNSTTGIAKERIWVLNMLKTAATTAQAVAPRLQFFREEVMGLARQCDKLAVTRPASEKNFHRGCVVSLWALFPSFCNCPSDLEIEIEPLSDRLCGALGDKRYPDLLTNICNGLIVAVKTFDEKGGLELSDSSSNEKNALGLASKKLLPTLFKLITDVHAALSSAKTGQSNDMDVEGESKKTTGTVDGFQKFKCVTEAISQLAHLVETHFLEGLFKTVMQRLLAEFQSESGDGERICALLTLSQALVASRVLSEDSLSFLYRALKPLVKNDESPPRVQKRAYKVLHELCEKHPGFVTSESRLKELTVLLTGTIMSSQISARHMRLRCMSSIVNGLANAEQSRMSDLNDVVPEVLLCLKDFNVKTRDAAYGVMLCMASQGNLVEFVNVILAALGAKTPHMRSAVVLALSRLVFEHARENDELKTLLPRLLQTILVLVNEGSREVLKSVVGFVRICVSAIPPDDLRPIVPELLSSLLNSQQIKSRFRQKIKIILKKLVKLYGYEALMQNVPVSETRLLTHMRKLDERERRKKQSSRDEMESRLGDFDDMVESDEDDSDEGKTFVTGATGLMTKKSRRTASSVAGSILSRKTTAGNTKGIRLPDEEDDGEVVDLLGSKMAKRVHFTEDESDDDSDGGALEFDDDGRLVVLDDDDDEMKADVQDTNSRSLDQLKRKRTSAHEPNREDKGNASKRRKASLGASYQSRKAGGDVKRKGQKYEPYAYVPLDGRSYSKKNRRNAVDQMASVVRGSRKNK